MRLFTLVHPADIMADIMADIHGLRPKTQELTRPRNSQNSVLGFPILFCMQSLAAGAE